MSVRGVVTISPRFASSGQINELILTTNPDWRDEVLNNMTKAYWCKGIQVKKDNGPAIALR